MMRSTAERGTFWYCNTKWRGVDVFRGQEVESSNECPGNQSFISLSEIILTTLSNFFFAASAFNSSVDDEAGESIEAVVRDDLRESQ